MPKNSQLTVNNSFSSYSFPYNQLGLINTQQLLQTAIFHFFPLREMISAFCHTFRKM